MLCLQHISVWISLISSAQQLYLASACRIAQSSSRHSDTFFSTLHAERPLKNIFSQGLIYLISFWYYLVKIILNIILLNRIRAFPSLFSHGLRQFLSNHHGWLIGLLVTLCLPDSFCLYLSPSTHPPPFSG